MSVAAMAILGELSFLTKAVNVKFNIKKGEKQRIIRAYV